MLAHQHDARFEVRSAVTCGVKEIREVVAAAALAKEQGITTVLFLDEVHRFNEESAGRLLAAHRKRHDHFCGATTENPSFALNNALLSRARVYVLKPLAAADLVQVMQRALEELQVPVPLGAEHLQALANGADGDARRALGLLELVLGACAARQDPDIDAIIRDALGGQLRRFDKSGDEFYDQISALHKAVRGSDPDASLYWLCRMLDGRL